MIYQERFRFEDWYKVMDLDLRGVFLLIKDVLPQMIKQKSWSIVIINAIAPGMHLTDLFAKPDEGMRKVIEMHIENTPL